MSWLKDWFDTAKQVVFSPSQFFANLEPEDSAMPLVGFAVTSSMIAVILNAVFIRSFDTVLYYSIIQETSSLIQLILVGVIVGTIGPFIIAAFYHVFIYLLGGRGYMDTVNIAAYSTAVQAFFGWIPVINIIVSGVYAYYVWIKGIEELHDFPTARAVVVMIVPVILILCAGAFMIYFGEVDQCEPVTADTGPADVYISDARFTETDEMMIGLQADRETVNVTDIRLMDIEGEAFKEDQTRVTSRTETTVTVTNLGVEPGECVKTHVEIVYDTEDAVGKTVETARPFQNLAPE